MNEDLAIFYSFLMLGVGAGFVYGVVLLTLLFISMLY